VVAALRSPQVLERLQDLGFEVVGSTPAAFDLFQRAEIARWTRVVQAGGITAE
jgi:tripartite-type tricarboxylate transporter receptor subunit TctC